MSGKIVSMHELSARLDAGVNCGADVAGNFLREFSTVVSQGLAADGRVHIDGLGEFKTVIDVTGNTTVEFAPDSALAGSVNAPFAMFEPVELADSITDDELNTERDIAMTEVAETPAAGPEIAPEPANEPEPATEAEPANEPVATESAGTLPPPLPPRFTRKEQVVADEPEPEIAPEPESVIEPEPAPEPVPAPFEAPVQIPEPCAEFPYAQAGEHGCEQNPLAVRLEPESSVTIQRIGHTNLTLIVTAIAACLLGLIIGYLSYKWLNNTLPANVEILEDGILIKHDSGVVAEEIIPFETMDEDSLYADDDVQTIAAEDSTELPGGMTHEQIASSKMSPAVVTDTVGPGNYLSVMARRHYGNAKFWVYIYLENKDKIRNPDNLENGMVLVIPPAEKYGIDPESKESLRQADREAFRVMEQ